MEPKSETEQDLERLKVELESERARRARANRRYQDAVQVLREVFVHGRLCAADLSAPNRERWEQIRPDVMDLLGLDCVAAPRAAAAHAQDRQDPLAVVTRERDVAVAERDALAVELEKSRGYSNGMLAVLRYLPGK